MRALVPTVILALALPLAACGDPSGTPAASAPSAAAGHFEGDGLVVDFPPAWRLYQYDMITMRGSVIAWLSMVDIPDPCATSSPLGDQGPANCRVAYQLDPGTVVVSVGTGSFPGGNILDVPAAADPVTVGGLPGFIEETGPVPETGADRSLVWTLAMPGSIDNWYTVRAEFRGPDEAPLEAQVRAMVAGLRYDPSVVPLPSGATAAQEAAAGALARLRERGAAWACFPDTGSRTMVLRETVNGPLAGPQVAACSTMIEATPLQLWRLHLVLRLSGRTPSDGFGNDITIFVGADGSPGAMSVTSIQE